MKFRSLLRVSLRTQRRQLRWLLRSKLRPELQGAAREMLRSPNFETSAGIFVAKASYQENWNR
jgi:hypothetical protein